MDTAFLNQTGITADWAFTALSFYPDEKKHPWLKRIVPFVFSRALRDEIQGGDGWFVLPGLRMHFTRQGFFRVDTGWGQEPWAQQIFETRSTRFIVQAQITRWLNLVVDLPVRAVHLLRSQGTLPGPLALPVRRGLAPAQLALQPVDVLGPRDLRPPLGQPGLRGRRRSTRRRASSSTATSRRARSCSTTARESRS